MIRRWIDIARLALAIGLLNGSRWLADKIIPPVTEAEAEALNLVHLHPARRSFKR